jgi:Mn-dependent DtxR family transcriptional regulator
VAEQTVVVCGRGEKGRDSVNKRIPKNGPLLERHLAILRTVQELQPCGSSSIADRLGVSRDTVYSTIFHTLYRRGLVESDIIRIPGKAAKRKYGTIRLTEAGERLISQTGT